MAELAGARGAERAPDVSFIMPAYNVASYVEDAIRSVLNQTGVTVEVIVVDDASRDDTPRIVARLAEVDCRIILVQQPINAGAAAARNVAIDQARGRWLAFVDADDLIAPDRSIRLIDLAEATCVEVVADNFERFNDKGTLRSTMIPEGAQPYSFFVDTASFMRRNALFDRRANLGYIKPMFRASFIEKHRIRHQEEILIGEDYHFCLTCLLEGARFLVTSDSYYRYRVRDGSLSWRLSRADILRLREAHAALGIHPGSAHDKALQEAAKAYERSLDVALKVTSAMDDARAGRWAQALATAALNPGGWGLLTRFAGEAVGKRVALSSASA